MFIARCGLTPYITQIRFFFKRLTWSQKNFLNPPSLPKAENSGFYLIFRQSLIGNGIVTLKIERKFPRSISVQIVCLLITVLFGAVWTEFTAGLVK
jgi:hypothetical protein